VKNKKILFAISALFLFGVGYFLTTALICFFPQSQAGFIQMFNTSASFIAGIFAALTGTHTFMDWHSINQGAAIFEQEMVSVVNQEHAPKHYDDDSIQ
jgi:hypothetical protein